MARANRRCAFCAIAAGEAPARVVLDEPDVLAFLDTRPLFHGHVLVVPRRHVETLDRLPGALHGSFLGAVQRVQRGVEEGMEAGGSLHIVNNTVSQSVPHLHYHVIPRTKGDGLRFWLGPRHPYASDEEADRVLERVRSALPTGPLE